MASSGENAIVEKLTLFYIVLHLLLTLFFYFIFTFFCTGIFLVMYRCLVLFTKKKLKNVCQRNDKIFYMINSICLK